MYYVPSYSKSPVIFQNTAFFFWYSTFLHYLVELKKLGYKIKTVLLFLANILVIGF